MSFKFQKWNSPIRNNQAFIVLINMTKKPNQTQNLTTISGGWSSAVKHVFQSQNKQSKEQVQQVFFLCSPPPNWDQQIVRDLFDIAD